MTTAPRNTKMPLVFDNISRRLAHAISALAVILLLCFTTVACSASEQRTVIGQGGGTMSMAYSNAWTDVDYQTAQWNSIYQSQGYVLDAVALNGESYVNNGSYYFCTLTVVLTYVPVAVAEVWKIERPEDKNSYDMVADIDFKIRVPKDALGEVKFEYKNAAGTWIVHNFGETGTSNWTFTNNGGMLDDPHRLHEKNVVRPGGITTQLADCRVTLYERKDGVLTSKKVHNFTWGP